MVNVAFHDECTSLRHRGFTISEIMKATGRSKSTVHHHIKNIPLPEEKRIFLKREGAKKIAAMSSAWKDKSRLGRHPREFSVWTPELVNLLGHMIFDGEIKYGSCVFTNSNTVLLNHVARLMKLVYDFEPKRIESMPGVFKISYHNVELSNYLKIKSRELVASILEFSAKHQRAFLSAFFDDEGSVYFIGKRRAVRGYQHNIPMLKIIKKILANFGIEGRIDEKYQEIVISRQANIQKFSEEISFMPGLCVNGNRSNSVWKESLEKREILRRALASYQN